MSSAGSEEPFFLVLKDCLALVPIFGRASWAITNQRTLAQGGKMSGQIFISHRRQESGWSARSLHDPRG
jgi:hypothetical protein